ncbi:hypothetical protein HanIR_Chr17g0847171 [Helianthus annuus]|nr:hypothetical protein HanIR_Chr17g0847171 [Helianthus annuus]
MKIVTSIMTRIDESVVIKWNERTVSVRVVESCEQWLFDCDNDSMVDSSDSELESLSEEEDATDDMDDVEEGEIRQNPAGEEIKQVSDARPETDGERVFPAGENETSPVDSERSSGVQKVTEDQTSGRPHDCVETCQVHGEGEHVADGPNIVGGNGVQSNKSNNYFNVVDCGPNIFNPGEKSSGPYNSFIEEGPTPGPNLGKRNRDERSPPSLGSIQGPAQRPVYQSQMSPAVQLDLNSPIGDKFGTEEVLPDLPDLDEPNQEVRTPGNVENLRDSIPVEDCGQSEQNQRSNLRLEVEETIRIGSIIGINLNGFESEAHKLVVEEGVDNCSS